MKTKTSFKSGAARNLVFVLGILLCAGVLFGTLFVRIGRTDLQILVKAASDLEAGRLVYDLESPNEHTKPPFATLMFVPATFVPFGALSRLWDALNVGIYLWLALLFARLCTFGGGRLLALLGVLWTLNSWNQEIRLGQYNVLTLGMLWWALGSSRAFLGGAVVAIAVLLKPTNLFFLPLLIRTKRTKLAPFIGGGIALVAGLAVIYAARYGGPALRTDHYLWLSSLSASTAKHFLRFDNHSLLKALAELSSSTVVLVAARLSIAALIVIVSLRVKDILAAFAATAMLALFLNPLCWFQNFTLILPAAIFVFSQRFHARGRAARLLSAALGVSYLGLQIFNPEVCHLSPKIWEICTRPIPLYAVIISGALTLFALRIRETSPQSTSTLS